MRIMHRVHPRVRSALRFLIAVPLSLALLIANADIAAAHQMGAYHWHKTGTCIDITQYSTGTWATYAGWAREDGWNKIAILCNYASSTDQHVHAYSYNYGDINLCGRGGADALAWDWQSLGNNHITHGSAWVNEYCNYLYPVEVQGIFCQEIAHTWGLDHSATNDCMGYGYYYNNTYYYGSHNDSDFSGIYRYH